MSRNEMSQDIEKVLGVDARSRATHTWRKWLIWGVLGVLAILLALMLLRGRSSADAVSFVTRDVSRGDLVVTVSATGTIEPLNEVNVGIEVSGTVSDVLVDFNDVVEKGQLLLTLDTTILEAEVSQSQASLDLARANFAEAQATLAQAMSELERLERVRELSGGAVPSEQEMTTALAAVDRAKAAVSSSRAQIRQTQAQLSVKSTQLQKAQVISPINGVVLSRLVDPGQTVAASLQAPELFVLAEDLKEMELHVEIDEADVGQVGDGQKATFTVDAYPDEEFLAEITQLRYAPIASEGVVTYEALLSVDNSDLRLRPGMTATAVITVQEIKDAVLVPNEALRFTPVNTDAGAQKSSNGGLVGALTPRPMRRGGGQRSQDQADGPTRQVWTLSAEGEPTPVAITVGASDGSYTQMLSGDLQDGAQVITDQRNGG